MRLPNCDFCKHFHEEIKGNMCCEAFPEGIPSEKISWGDDGTECANGIKFEDVDGEDTEFVPKPGSLLAKMHRI